MEPFPSAYCTVYPRESIGDLSRKSCGCLYNTSETSPRWPWSTFNSCGGCEMVIFFRAHLCYQNPRALPHSESSYVYSVIIRLSSLSRYWECGQLELGSHGSEVVPCTERERSLSNPQGSIEPSSRWSMISYIFKR